MKELPRETKRRRPATLADVGRAAGVSAMAVSAALNDTRTSSRISEETRARILKAAERLGYRPNVAARALLNRRMNTIGVAAVFDRGELNHYFLEIFNGVIEAATRLKQNATVFTLRDWAEDAERFSEMCDGRIDGMILIAPILTAERFAGLPKEVPFVALHANAEAPGLLNLESDEEQGMSRIVQALIDQGHRRILHVSGPRGLLGVERRIRGYRQALSSSGFEMDPQILSATGFEAHHGRAVIEAWLKENAGKQLPHAICCASDTLAIGCLETLAGHGLKAPDDFSLTGFDDTLGARTTVPQLSTVRQPLREMGARAVELLVERVDAVHGKPLESTISPLIFPTEVVMRASVGNPVDVGVTSGS